MRTNGRESLCLNWMLKERRPIRTHLIGYVLTCSGYPELGISAIERLLSCLNDLLATEWPSSPRFGKTTFNIGTIAGGAAANIVPGNGYLGFL